MLRFILSVIVVLLVSTTVLAEDSKVAAVQDAKIDFSQLKNWKERTYSMTFIDLKNDPPTEQVVGRMIFNCDYEKDGITIKNTTRMYLPDGERYVEFIGKIIFKQPNFWSVDGWELKASRSDGLVLNETTAKVNSGNIKLKDTEKGVTQTKEFQWDEKSIPDLSVFYLVTLLPQETGRKYVLKKHVNTSTPKDAAERILECSGLDVSLPGKNKNCIQFVEYDVKNPTNKIRYWINKERVLIRVLLAEDKRLDLKE
jgi:hypothetical protein